MRFDYIDSKVSSSDVILCQDKITGLLIDLSLRKNNTYIGSGLGGNSLQLFILLNAKHHLSSNSVQDISYDSDTKKFTWAVQSLASSTLNTLCIRQKLDNIFPEILKNNMQIELVHDKLINSQNIEEIIKMLLCCTEHQDCNDHPEIGKACLNLNIFPELIDQLSLEENDLMNITLDNFSNLEKFCLIWILCQRAKNYLIEKNSNNIYQLGSFIKNLGEFLDKFSEEYILFPIRCGLGIDIIVKFGLIDIFENILRKIDSYVR